MPFQDPDPEDPMFLTGVSLPGDDTSSREMAWVFAEEFARLGYSEPQILSLFRHSFYAGAHDAWRQLGAETVTAIVRENVAVWGRIRRVAPDPGVAAAGPPPFTGEEDLHE